MDEIIHDKCGKPIGDCMCSDAEMFEVPCDVCDGVGKMYLHLSNLEEVPDAPKDLEEHSKEYFEKLKSGQMIHEANQILMFTRATLKAEMDERQKNIHWTAISLSIDKYFNQKGE